MAEGEVRRLLDTYSKRYDAEDLQGSGALLTPDVVRHSGSDTQDREEALAEYGDQFRTHKNPRYQLDVESVTPGQSDADVSARYSISSSNYPPATGDISFHVIRSDGDLLIDEITVTPDQH